MGVAAVSSSDLGRRPPVLPGGARSGQDDGEGDVEMRRSQRSWKPSVSCLESIAFVSREVSQAEMEMGQFDAMSVGDGQYCGATTYMPTLQDKGVGTQLPPRVLNSDFRAGDPLSGDKGRYSLVDGDLAFWFWECVQCNRLKLLPQETCGSHGPTTGGQGPHS